MLRQPNIYFDNASTSFPKPSEITEYIENYLQHIGGSPGRGGHRIDNISDNYITNIRKKVSSIFNIFDCNHLVFTSNATHSLNIIIKGYFKPGDHALVCNYSHNAVLRPLHHLKGKNIITYDIFDINENGEVDEEQVKQLIKHNTKIIICNHASNVIGVKAPISQISRIAKENGLHFLLDCTQSAIYVDIDVVRDNIDFLVGTGHKTLLGPSGIGFLYIKDESLVDYLMEGGSGGNHSVSPVHPKRLPYKFEAGTINYIGIAGLDGALNYINKVNTNNIIMEVCKLTEHAIKQLAQFSECKIYGALDVGKKIPVISFNLTGWRPAEIAHILDEKYSIMVRPGIQCAPLIHKFIGTLPNGTVRVSFSHMNNVSEIDFLCTAIQEILDMKR